MKKSLFNPTPAQIKYRNRLWALELLKNKRKARETMRDGHGGRCCLAVAEDVARSICGKDFKQGDETYPSRDTQAFFGWDCKDPYLTIDGEEYRASYCNDGGIFSENKKIRHKGLSHAQVAELVVNTFVVTKKRKLSFSI